jgi:hypothetical protein
MYLSISPAKDMYKPIIDNVSLHSIIISGKKVKETNAILLRPDM